MSWERKEKPKTVQATKLLVKEFAEMEKLPRERPLSERRLQIYRRLLSAGEFRPVTWASAHCKETDTIYRVNGQHTSTLLAELEKLPDFFVTVERYVCDTLEDVAKLYATFDSGIGSRTNNDIIQSFASTIKELAGIKKKTFISVVAAASYHKWGLTYHQHPPAERAELLFDHIEFAIWADGILWPTDSNQEEAKHMNRAGVVTAMMGSYQKSQSDSDKFWRLVQTGDAPKANDPSRVLQRYLLRTRARTCMASAPRGKETASFREMLAKCTTAWSAWRKGVPTDLKYYHSAKMPAFV